MKSLFLSEEQRRQAFLRTHPAFKALFCVLALCASAQVWICIAWNRLHSEQHIWAARSAAASVEGKRLKTLQRELEPLLQKAALAAEWSGTLSGRAWLSQVLSDLERALPPQVFLRTLRARNLRHDLRAPDRFQIEITGHATGEAPESVLAKLQESLPDWTVAHSGAPSPSSEAEREERPSFSLVLRAPNRSVPALKEP